MLVTLSAIASEQSKPTDETMNKCKQFLNYVATHPNAIITFIQSKSDMVLAVSSNAHRISSNQKSTKPSRRTFLHVKRHAVPTKQNGAILNIAQIIKSVMTSAAEAEMGALYINAREMVPMRAVQILRGVRSLENYRLDRSPGVQDQKTLYFLLGR